MKEGGELYKALAPPPDLKYGDSLSNDGVVYDVDNEYPKINIVLPYKSA